MAYSNNPNLPKARAIAMKMLIIDQLPLRLVANRCGVNRSTIWRWYQKWLKLNPYVQLSNCNRTTRTPGKVFRFTACRWLVPTSSSRPKTNHRAIPEYVIQRVLYLRRKLKRCAEVIWHHITKEGTILSLSSVRRILKRNHYIIKSRKPKLRPDNPKRPRPERPGHLVQMDTIHYVCPNTKTRRYVYTVIDLYSRMTYVKIYNRILPGLAAKTALEATKALGFKFNLVQTDNGPEFSSYFEATLKSHGIQVRHTRLGRPNDNAHIERFNRTIQDECLGRTIPYNLDLNKIQTKIDKYIDYYNHQRIHLSLELRTPSEMLQRS